MDKKIDETTSALIRKSDLNRATGNIITVKEIYLDGKLKPAHLVDEDDKSYGIFMHSLILSNYAEVMQVNPGQIQLIGNEYEKAIYHYTESKGFNKSLIEKIAPRVKGMVIPPEESLQVSTHLINEKVRMISKGTPEDLLKKCSHILLNSKSVKVSKQIFQEANRILLEMINRSAQVYAIAIKDVSRLSRFYQSRTPMNKMTLVALVGVG